MAWEENSRICLHMQLIAILSRTVVYYYISNDNLAELKYFIDEDNISEKLINRESIKELNEDSNPVILYYEYKN